MKTEFGKTFEDMKEVESRRTPLQMKMDELGKRLSFLSFGIIGVIAVVGVLQVRVSLALPRSVSTMCLIDRWCCVCGCASAG